VPKPATFLYKFLYVVYITYLKTLCKTNYTLPVYPYHYPQNPTTKDKYQVGYITLHNGKVNLVEPVVLNITGPY